MILKLERALVEGSELVGRYNSNSETVQETKIALYCLPLLAKDSGIWGIALRYRPDGSGDVG